ncbi:MAG: tetratricopeptide repeat-containing sensor histidine kinase [Chloroherpetonaceae bacterium]
MPNRVPILESEIERASSDEARIDAMNALAWDLRLSSPLRGLDISIDAYQRANAIAYLKGKAESAKNAAVCHWYLSNYEVAADFAFESLELFRTLNDPFGEAAALNWIANTFYRLGDKERALNYHFESLSLKKRIGDKHGEAYSLSNLAHLYREQGDFSQALFYAHAGFVLRSELDDTVGIAMSLHDLACVYGDSGDESNALQYFNECLSLARTVNEHYIVATTLYRVGCLHLKARRVSEAEQSLTESLKVSEEISARDWIYLAHAALSELYESTQDYAKALHHHKAYHQIEKTVLNQNATRHVESLIAKFEVEHARKEAEIYRLKNIELVEANMFKTHLLAIASHDLKTPLQSIMGFTFLLKEQETLAPHAEKYLSLIESASQRMLSLITDLLDNAALESGQLSLNREPVNLSELISELVRNFTPQAALKSQRFDIALSPNLHTFGDRARLLQVFENLISNAIKYSPIGGCISMRCYLHDSEDGKNIRFALKDEGQGFTEEEKSKLFKKFQRLSALPTGNERSTGLGLSIAKDLVVLHGGDIWAESEGNGKGATFFVNLPLHSLSPATSSTAAALQNGNDNRTALKI